MTSRIAYNNPDGGGALGLPFHYEMLSDRRRLKPLARAIRWIARGKRVLESGAGSGVLSLLAAKAGARCVYAIEKDPAVSRFLRHNVRASEWGSMIRVIEKDSRSVTLDDVDGQPVDLVITEHLSTWQVTEPQISVMNHVNSDLTHPSTIWIPENAFNCVELVRSKFRFEDVVDLRTYYFGFTGVRKPTVFSAPTLFRKIDFGLINEAVVDQSVDVVANCAGVINSLRLTSPLRILGDISFRSSDSLMPPVVLPLREDMEIHKGDVVNVRFRYRYETSWGDVESWASLVDSRHDVTPSTFVSAFSPSVRAL
jgi:predicted RNA methylase